MREFFLLLSGVIIGVLIFFFRGYILNARAERMEAKRPENLVGPIFNKLKDTIRHIVAEYSIRRKNHDIVHTILRF